MRLRRCCRSGLGTVSGAVALAAVATLVACSAARAEDWLQFRGPGGAAATDDPRVPTTWGDTEHLRWKLDLPGPGSSSPIVVGPRVYVTCYSGYGTGTGGGGSAGDLQRHLVAVDRATGRIDWTQTVPGSLPEDEYSGFLTEHGYASSTPTSDGETIYCFFGKSGVVAFDANSGKERWRVEVGKESSNRRWGSGASLLLVGDALIVNAAEESRSIRALDKRTGRQLWMAQADLLELAYATPAVVEPAVGPPELVVVVPEEIWGLNPANGKLKWFIATRMTGNVSPSPIVDGETVYLFGGFRSAGSMAIRTGGAGDATATHVKWTGASSSYVATPVLHDGHLYWIDDRGIAWCVRADTGQMVYRERVPGLDGGGRPVYASPLRVRDRLLVVSRWNGTFVLPARPSFEVLAQNRFADDTTDANATPAVADGTLYLRTNRRLYAIGDKP